MKDYFKEIFEYNLHANRQLIALMLQHWPDISERSQQLISHLLNAHQIWNGRILNAPTFEVWQLNDQNILSDLNTQNYENTLKIIEEFPLEENVDYSNSKGEKFSNKIRDLLFHVVNHSTYHRAQIAADLRQNGIEPINTDYIFYKRNHL
ncbi:DinB family protein [Chryseobacterium sp.]|uniref:DinB family protein n=1 Tax=Chryseobacterium sp. TaxID=1871047 RepID=UPI0011C8520F|nr:DinB family protein [Chryseobacterium sp.]TXF74946.1 damage-inducible protein DinB [Chryseobacterium sp.]